MKVYIIFFINIFIISFLYVLGVAISLVFILNFLGELDFFQGMDVKYYFALLLAFLNSPIFIFDMFPFIFLVTAQLFFIKLFNNNELITFKYSGLKNSSIVLILCTISLITGIFIITVFYNLSSNLKNFYLELKSPYTTDGKYLAVITNNGLWIRDKIENKTIIINASKIDQNYLIDNFITEFDSEFNVTKNIMSKKINISKKEWLIYDAKVYNKNDYILYPILNIKTNFNYKTINTLYSNLNSLNIFELYKLRKNYKKLNYSITEVDLQLLKLATLPFFLVLMTVFSSLIMLKIRHLTSSTFKISLGIFFSVIIYYFNNFFFVLGNTEKLSIYSAILIPLIILTTINVFMLNKINEQ